MLEVLVIEQKRLEFCLIPTVHQPPMRKLASILARTQALNCFHLLSFAFVCFHLRAPCFHHAPNLHLYSVFLRMDVPITLPSVWVTTASMNAHYLHPPNLKSGIKFTKIRRSNIDFRRALAFTLLAFAFNYGRLRTFLLAH